MNDIKSLRNFATIYLWIFAVKVLQVSGDVEYRTDVEGNRAAMFPGVLMKPYVYKIFDDDYTDELLNERNAVATPLWRTLNKQRLYYSKHLPLIMRKTKAKKGNSMTSREITFENLNDLDSERMKNTISPKIHNKQQQQQQQHQQQQHHVKANINSGNDINQERRHSLQQFLIVRSSLVDDSGGGGNEEADRQDTSMANIRYKQNAGILPMPIILQKKLKTKNTSATKKSNTPFNNADADAMTKNVERGLVVSEGNGDGDGVKENLFPLKDDTITLNGNDVEDDSASYENEDRAGVSVAFADEENGIANSNGNGNESLNYANNNEANINYMMTQSPDNEHNNRDFHDKQLLNLNNQLRRRRINKPHDKRAKPSVGHTPFLPTVSGGAMTNLGKFFRDLSKNVHVSEQYQWDAAEQKLLEGDPNFSNIHHHLTKPNAATDQQTAEWIKAIRFYRPSQQIRSLVEMNPHGQWAHSSQFIDPNYMWVGLGKRK